MESSISLHLNSNSNTGFTPMRQMSNKVGKTDHIISSLRIFWFYKALFGISKVAETISPNLTLLSKDEFQVGGHLVASG